VASRILVSSQQTKSFQLVVDSQSKSLQTQLFRHVFIVLKQKANLKTLLSKKSTMTSTKKLFPHKKHDPLWMLIHQHVTWS